MIKLLMLNIASRHTQGKQEISIFRHLRGAIMLSLIRTYSPKKKKNAQHEK